MGLGGLFMDMGTGKTKVAIDFIGLGFYNWNVRRVVVVCPATVVPVWPYQIETHAPYPYTAYPLFGSSKQKLAELDGTVPHSAIDQVIFIIINYESIWRRVGKRAIADALLSFKPDLIIFDESHKIKSPTSKQSKAAYKLSQPIPRRLLLTGTHITKSPMDSFGQFRAMNPEVFGTNWYSFKHTWAVWGGFGGFQLIRYLHFDEFIKRVRAHSFRIKKEQCFTLPKATPVYRPVTLTPKNRTVYEEMAKEAIVEIEGHVATAPIALAKLNRLQQITSGFIKDENGELVTLGTEKLDACMDLVDEIMLEGRKVGIACRFIYDIQQISGALAKRDLKFRILSGSVPDRKSVV
jgi:SNF2 family DNA or RNA helicase